MKFKEGKYRPSLVYSSLLKEISKVRQYGKEKHGGFETWDTTKPIEHFDAAVRHINAYVEGETNDKESGLNHLSHSASNLMFEIERLYREEVGDTPVHGVPPTETVLITKEELISEIESIQEEEEIAGRDRRNFAIDSLIQEEEDNELSNIWSKL